MRIIHFKELTSTNDEAMNGKYVHGTVVVADKQTAGRGQRGNKWISHGGENLTFSIVVEPNHIPVVEQYRISMMAALAASDALREYGVQCMIKWSNDLYVGDRKIGGILIEHSLMGEMLTKSVIGIGINVLQRDFPEDLPNPTSMINEGCEISPTKLLDTVIEKFKIRYSHSSEELHSDYMARLWRKNGNHLFSDVSGEFLAHIEKVDALTGQLSLRKESGVSCDFWFKEVEFLL